MSFSRNTRRANSCLRPRALGYQHQPLHRILHDSANRAVMHWMSHDDGAAQKDLTRAQEVAPQSDFVARNVAALNAHLTVAMASKD